MAQCEANGIWDSVWWWYKNLAEFTLEWEFPNFPEEERDKIFPLLKRQLEGNFDAQEFSDADMIIVGDPEQCLAEDAALRRARRRPADLLRAVRPPRARVDHADDRAARHRDHPRARSGADVAVDASGRRVMTRTDDTPVPDYPGLLRLDGRRFVVLGAGQGIGRQASHALASVGARLACVDQSIPTSPPTSPPRSAASALSGDAIDRARRGAHVRRRRPRKLGGIDGVVDIIGMSRYADLVDMTDDDWNWHFDIVLRHAFLAMQYGGPGDGRDGGGAMVFVASVSGITSAPRHSAYGAAKAGLMSLVRTGAVELGPSGIRVNAVAPGRGVDAAGLGVPRRRGRAAQHREHAAAPRRATGRHRRRAPVPRVGPRRATSPGQTLTVDGGVGAKFPYPMADL